MHTNFWDRTLAVRIAAIVVNWNGGDANRRCIRSLLEQTEPPAQIVFVDNGSTDGSREAVLAEFPELIAICNALNLGYAGANNQGIRLALERGADAVLVVNNDVELDPGALALLASALERSPEIGCVGPRVVLRERPDTLWAVGGALTWRENLTTLIGNGEPDGEAWRTTRAVDYVPGCCLLARRELLEAIGGFDEEYFAYTEDVDFGLSARRAGFGALVVGQARVRHEASTSTGGGYNPRRKYMMGLNSVLFLRRHARPRQWLTFVVFDVLTLPFAWLAGLPRGRGKAVVAKAWGIWCGLRGQRVDPARLEPGSTWLW